MPNVQLETIFSHIEEFVFMTCLDCGESNNITRRGMY
ncbi:hypothetical protein LCGC14_0547880 [marine sediment metagenome]|uniref:Uncharacterized protein n=1 Tax=marine sediment metagenome TaxID=412755 RepID=A0A0F9UCA3_9ZZZZ